MTRREPGSPRPATSIRDARPAPPASPAGTPCTQAATGGSAAPTSAKADAPLMKPLRPSTSNDLRAIFRLLHSRRVPGECRRQVYATRKTLLGAAFILDRQKFCRVFRDARDGLKPRPRRKFL